MSTTPTTPQWAVNVTVADGKYTVRQSHDGKLEALRYGQPWRDLTGDGLVLALAQAVESAPPLSPSAPTDEAGLRDKIVEILQHYNPTIRTGYGDATRRIMDLFAPHLSQREPGDSELLDWLFDKTRPDGDGYHFIPDPPRIMQAQLAGEDGAFCGYKTIESRKQLIAVRAAIKSAQRGEGKP